MQTLTAEQLRRVIEGPQRVPVINVLDQESYDRKHIPDSVSVPLTEPNFVDQVDEQVSERTDPLVVYCASSSCDASERAAEKLEQAGFTGVRDFEGGVKGWEDAGYRLEGEGNARPT